MITIGITHNPANRRIQDVAWTNNSGRDVAVTIWQDGQEIYTEIIPATETEGSRRVPGNHTMREDPEEPGHWMLPAGLTYKTELI